MASCELNITGTSGTVVIKYKLSGIDHSMTGSFGDTLFINDDATDVTYTTLSGNAAVTAVMACVTITELPFEYYIFTWETIGKNNAAIYDWKIGAIINNTEVTTFTAIDYTKVDAWKYLATSIKNLNNVDFTPTSGLQTLSTRNSGIENIVIGVIGAEVKPELRVDNAGSGLTMYIKGALAGSAIPEGFEDFLNVESDL